MTKQIIQFQIKHKQNLIFNLLKHNKNLPYKQYKKCAFKRFKLSCDYSKEQINTKNNMFNKIFCKFLYAKCGLISFKNYLLNKKIEAAQNIINHNKMQLFYQKTNFKIFIQHIKIKIKIKKIFNKYKEYVIKQNYIIFFKQIAI